MIHLPSISLQGMGHPPIAISRKIQDNFLYRITQRNLFSSLGWRNLDVLFGIVPGAIHLQQLAEMTNGNGLLLLTCVFNYRMSLFKGSLPNASDRISPFQENSYTHSSLLIGCCKCQCFLLQKFLAYQTHLPLFTSFKERPHRLLQCPLYELISARDSI
jgi:hypothetical protein